MIASSTSLHFEQLNYIEENLVDQDLWRRKGIIWKNLKDKMSFGSVDEGINGTSSEKQIDGETDHGSETKF